MILEQYDSITPLRNSADVKARRQFWSTAAKLCRAFVEPARQMLYRHLYVSIREDERYAARWLEMHDEDDEAINDRCNRMQTDFRQLTLTLERYPDLAERVRHITLFIEDREGHDIDLSRASSACYDLHLAVTKAQPDQPLANFEIHNLPISHALPFLRVMPKRTLRLSLQQPNVVGTEEKCLLLCRELARASGWLEELAFHHSLYRHRPSPLLYFLNNASVERPVFAHLRRLGITLCLRLSISIVSSFVKAAPNLEHLHLDVEGEDRHTTATEFHHFGILRGIWKTLKPVAMKSLELDLRLLENGRLSHSPWTAAFLSDLPESLRHLRLHCHFDKSRPSRLVSSVPYLTEVIELDSLKYLSHLDIRLLLKTPSEIETLLLNSPNLKRLDYLSLQEAGSHVVVAEEPELFWGLEDEARVEELCRAKGVQTTCTRLSLEQWRQQSEDDATKSF